jgi:glycosyltransferase involved in cell wall biosynthesis
MRKGADLLAPIMRELVPDFELRFTSGLRDLKINDAVPNMIPLGRLAEDSQLQEAYHQCDALLFPSRFEGLPHAPLEAMACGKPVIAANSSSLAEVVEDGVTGILCPTDDIGAFVTACRRLADNPEVLREYGKAARRRVEEYFSEDVIIPQYISLYERLCDEMGR